MTQSYNAPDLSAPFSAEIDIARAKRDAKRLKTALMQNDPTAISRFDAVFNTHSLKDRKPAKYANHADCLHVIAREAGAPSWPRLKLAIETALMHRKQRLSTLFRAAMKGNFLLINRLLELDLTLISAHPGMMAAFGREDDLLRCLQTQPSCLDQVFDGYPVISALCFSKCYRHDPVPEAFINRQIRMLDQLLDAGAGIDTRVPAAPGSDHGLSLLYGALGHAGNLKLAKALLERGANPDDNESLYHATELPDLDGVRLMFSYGATIAHTNAFYRLLDRETPEGVQLFLDHSADPNAPPYQHPTTEPIDARNALHHAIIRGRSAEICQMLITAGVDATKSYNGRSPFALASSCGNQDAARLLERLGYADELDPANQLMAAISAADKVTARKLLHDHPNLVASLSQDDLSRQTDLAMRADSLPVLAMMIDLGFDINIKGEGDSPPIHSAAWWGHPEIVELYINAGARLDLINMQGGDTLATAIHGSAHCPAREHGNYIAVVTALLDAGAVIKPDQGHLDIGSDAVTLLLESRLEAQNT